jgi:hypothetical protein
MPMHCLSLTVLLVRSQRLRLFVCHCEECMMQICGAMSLTVLSCCWSDCVLSWLSRLLCVEVHFLKSFSRRVSSIHPSSCIPYIPACYEMLLLS